MENNIKRNNYDEKILKPINGWLMLAVCLAGIIGGILLITFGSLYFSGAILATMITFGVIFIIVGLVLSGGFRVIAPNEALVSTLFGKYCGSIKKEGFFWIHPFCSSFNPTGKKGSWNATGIYTPGDNMKISLKAMTLNNEKQKVNDLEGNPIEIGVIVIWQISDTAKAVFNVDNYLNFISIQSDAAIRNIARQYPYDLSEDGEEKSLRGSSQEIADVLRDELQKSVEIAGIKVVEARIAHLAYSQEIAAAMLQRQQAKAIVDARITIVEGAVGMVELALAKLAQNGIVELDEERKAQMVSNLMVVLCANKDAQPIVNSGSLY